MSDKFKRLDYNGEISYRKNWGGPVTIMGTEWAREKVIVKNRNGRKWRAYTLCNGITDDNQEFPTLKAAKAAYGG